MTDRLWTRNVICDMLAANSPERSLSMSKLSRRTGAVGALIPLLLLASCGGEDSATGGGEGGDAASGVPEFVTIATGGTGGVYYPVGGAMGSMLANEIEGVKSGTAETTGGSVENLQLLGDQRTTIAMAMNDAVYNAVNGEGDFDQPQDVCTIGIMYPNVLQVVTTEDTGIESFQDLAGKRVSVGDAGSATELMFENVVTTLGMSFDDFGKAQHLPFDGQTTAIRNGQLDAGAWVVAPGASSIQDLASSEDIKVVPLDEESLNKVTEKFPYYIGTDLEAGTYDGQDEAVPVAATWNSLLMSSKADQEFVGQVTRAVHENVDALASAHPAGGEVAPENITEAIAPVCPGAMEYFEEAGVEVPQDLQAG
jgi:TRAP transporter TAXI family solute receptor